MSNWTIFIWITVCVILTGGAPLHIDGWIPHSKLSNRPKIKIQEYLFVSNILGSGLIQSCGKVRYICQHVVLGTFMTVSRVLPSYPPTYHTREVIPTDS